MRFSLLVFVFSALAIKWVTGFPCAAIHCSYCPNSRIDMECDGFCKKNCGPTTTTTTTAKPTTRRRPTRRPVTRPPRKPSRTSPIFREQRPPRPTRPTQPPPARFRPTERAPSWVSRRPVTWRQLWTYPQTRATRMPVTLPPVRATTKEEDFEYDYDYSYEYDSVEEPEETSEMSDDYTGGLGGGMFESMVSDSNQDSGSSSFEEEESYEIEIYFSSEESSGGNTQGAGGRSAWRSHSRHKPTNRSPSRRKTTPKPKTGTKKKETASERFMQCCKKSKRIVSSCYNMCKFENIRKPNLMDVYFRKTCPPRSLQPLLDCASAKKDHTKCCRSNGFGGICADFCFPSKYIPGVNAAYLPCLDRVHLLAQCFRKNYD